MSYFQCHFQSKALLTSVTVTITLPFPFFDPLSPEIAFDEIYRIEKRFKTLYLFHGAFADANSWFWFTRVMDYANRYGFAIVAPNVGNSFYADLKHGPAYWTFVSEELPRYVRAVFPLSEKREDNFAAGLSMGGYGALKLALNKPEHYAAAVSLSGVLDIVTVMKNPIHPIFNPDEYFGGLDSLEGSHNDLFAQLRKLKQEGKSIPRLYIACGWDDNLYEMNKRFRDFALSNDVALTYEEGPGGHTWDFWDHYIHRALEWLASL